MDTLPTKIPTTSTGILELFFASYFITQKSLVPKATFPGFGGVVGFSVSLYLS